MVKELGTQHPIQVFLDTKQFVRTEIRPAGGGNRDFYQEDNSGFLRHKSRVQSQISDVISSMETDAQTAGFVMVQMREDALAKSYRPIRALFTPGHSFALVGGGRPGEMYFQASKQGLRRLEELIEKKAEEVPREVFNEKTQKVEKRVSAYRSEVGGIDTVRALTAADRVGFSAREAVDWLKTPGVLGGYTVRLFRPDWTVEANEYRKLVDQFIRRLKEFEGGIVALPVSQNEFRSQDMAISLVSDPSTKFLRLPSMEGVPSVEEESAGERPRILPDHSIARHQALLEALGNEPLVRSVELPPMIERGLNSEDIHEEYPDLPEPADNRAYPIVGLIDGGVADIPSLQAWRAGQASIIDPADRDEFHGTFIAGLLAAAGTLNPHIAGDVEPFGCKFFDLDILPREGLVGTYYPTPPEFFDQLETLIEKAKNEADVRVFNLSLGMPKARGRTNYSQFAAALDDIARRHDVIFIVSAGNLKGLDARPAWPSEGEKAVEMLASHAGNSDAITAPGEHLLGFTVGAVNPPNQGDHKPRLPTTYTRRGPGAGNARKPELSHYGGVTPRGSNQTGLSSIDEKGILTQCRGTSFATPLLAATIATLDKTLEGRVPRETLLALPIHRASRAPEMTHSALKHISREFVGYGMSPPANACLADDPYSVTLVFSEALRERQELEFIFTWPRALITDRGKCRGKVDLTLAYTPPIDPQFDSECLRARLEAHLHQLNIDEKTGEEKPQSKLKLEDSGLPQDAEYTERYLLENSLKWTPIMRYHIDIKRGCGNSSDWRLSLNSFTRAGAPFPQEGIPFTIVMTISDPKRESAIYDEVRNEVIRRGLRIADINVAHRLRVQ